jgi:ABC-2 type transport system ATP-binding protein
MNTPDLPGSEVAIEIDGLLKTFGAATALQRISTRIPRGRLTGLVGPDGAGKTTLLRLLAGLLSPTEGHLRVLGLDPVRDGPALADAIGYMPQRFGLYEDLSVAENMALYADLRGVLPERRAALFDTLLDFTRLGPFSRRLAGALSGGMKQKLGLACALMAQPKVLLLDEPGVGVDPVSRRELWRMVEALAADGMAVIWATAYLDEAEQCQSVILLNEGRIVHDGPPAALTATLHARSLALTGFVQDRRHLLQQVLTLPCVSDGVIQGDAVRVLLRANTDGAALQALAAGAGATVTPVLPRFEDAFIDLLGGGPGGHSALAAQMPALPHALHTPVSCQQLTRRFGSFTAAESVSFEVQQGEIFGLLGPNGAGKSTTFKMLCGLLKPSSGMARVAGFDLRTAASTAKGQLGYMAQKFSLYGLLSVRQNLDFYAGVYGLDGALKKERVQEMIETFALHTHLNDSPGDLPLGFKQRLALACALMHRPSVLFLDEPTSGVDPITRREFWTHINGLVRKGVTVLVTTHFMDEAEYCDRVALMYKARVIALDTPDALKQQAVQAGLPHPTMEDAFIHLIEQVDARERAA